MPNPGEIWMIRRDIPEFVPFPLLEHSRFSEPARHFMQGDWPSRHVMIVGDIHLLSEYSEVLELNGSTSKTDLHQANRNDCSSEFLDQYADQYWVSAMVLGHAQMNIGLDNPYGDETLNSLSDADILIPPHLSGVDHNLIAETWHIVPMLVNQLSNPVGHRVSSTFYNHLMDIGDAAIDPLSAISSSTLTSNPLHFFHQTEQQWSEVLRFPMTACHMQLELLEKTTRIIDRAIELERFSLE